MDLSVLIPTSDPIPVHWGWLKFFLILTFMLHILCMNAMVGTSIIALFSRRNADGNRTNELEKNISYSLPFLIAFTVNFGVAPLLFLQVLYGQFMYVSSILMAVYWLSIIGLLIIAYYSAYYYKFKFDELKENRFYFIGLSVLIFLFIGFLYTNNMTLMLTPKSWLMYFQNPNGTILNLSDPTVYPRFLHFMMASVAIGGLFIAIRYEFKKKTEVSSGKNNIDRGMKWFTYATLAQIIIGFWFQMSLPKEISSLFMGGSILHTVIFLIALALTIGVLYTGMKQKVWITTGLLLGLVFSMILMRDMVRTAYLTPFFNVSELKVLGEYSPLVFFLFSLAVTIAVVIYVIRLAVKSGQNLTMLPLE